MGKWSSKITTKYETREEAQFAVDHELPKGHNAIIKEIQ